MHDVASGDELMKAREAGNWSYPAFNRDGTLLASGTGEEIAVWDVASGRRKAIMHGHRGFVQKFEFSPPSLFLHRGAAITRPACGTLRLGVSCCACAGTGVPIAVLFRKSRSMPTAPCSPRAVRMRPIKIWDVHAGDAPSIASINDAGDGENVALSSAQTAPDYRQDLDWLFGHEAAVTDIDFTPDGKSLVSCSRDGTVNFGTLPKNDSSATSLHTVRMRGPCA